MMCNSNTCTYLNKSETSHFSVQDILTLVSHTVHSFAAQSRSLGFASCNLNHLCLWYWILLHTRNSPKSQTKYDLFSVLRLVSSFRFSLSQVCLILCSRRLLRTLDSNNIWHAGLPFITPAPWRPWLKRGKAAGTSGGIQGLEENT